MQTVVVRYKVKNFANWKKGQLERLKLFAPAIESFNAFQDVDKTKSIIVIMETADLELLISIINIQKNQFLKDKHTVIASMRMLKQIQF